MSRVFCFLEEKICIQSVKYLKCLIYRYQLCVPELNRTSGIRQFSENEIESLRVIECLKKTGLQIKDIKQFMSWCMEGSSTYTKRKELFENQKKQVEAEITKLNKTLDMLNFKCWYYSEAIKDGNEERLKNIIPNELQNSIKSAYINSHKE